MWVAIAKLRGHASVMPQSWQRKSKEFQFWKCFKLALVESYDASGEHRGGMTIRHFASQSRSFWGSGQGPDGEVQEAGGSLLPRGSGARSP